MPELLEDRRLLAAVTWTGNGDGTSWNQGSNWDTGSEPGSGDNAVIPDVAGTQIINVVGTNTVQRIDSSETLRIFGGTLTLTEGNSVVDSLEIGRTGFGAGNLRVNGDSLTADTVTQLTGTVDGSGDVTATGLYTWSAGTISGGGSTFANGGMRIEGDISKTLNGRTLVTNGTTTFTDTGAFLIGFGGVLRNTGTFDVQTDADINNLGGTGRVDNEGTFQKTAGSGTTTVSRDFTNSGVVGAQVGTLSLPILTNYNSGNGTLTGGTYRVNANLTLPGASIQTNAANIELVGPAAQIFGSSFSNALANLRTNTATGSMTTESGRDFATTVAFANAGSVTVGSGTTFATGGDYTQTGGRTTVLEGATLNPTGDLDIQAGEVGGVGAIMADVINGGIINPGGNPGGTGGLLTIAGNYTQTPTGILNIEVGGAFTINDVTQSEGQSSTTDFVFTVDLSLPSLSTVTVDYSTADSTAEAPADYTAVAATLTFSPGETSKSITVSVIGDTTTELTETFFVNLSNPSLGAAIADDQGIGTIDNEDGSLFIDSVSITEGTSSTTTDAIFTVSLTNVVTRIVTVDYTTVDGTATAANNDYVPTSGKLTFAPGETSKTITVKVNGDTNVESDETFTVDLSNPIEADFRLVFDGLLGEYRNAYLPLTSPPADWSGTPVALTRVDPTVNFQWANGSPDPLINADAFSVRWTGRILSDFAETYTFYGLTDDGFNIHVNDKLVTEFIADRGPGETSGSIALLAGQLNTIQMDFRENGGGAVAELRWSSPSIAKAIIPTDHMTSATVSARIGTATIVNDDGSLQSRPGAEPMKDAATANTSSRNGDNTGTPTDGANLGRTAAARAVLPGFDQLNITGTSTLGGTLNVVSTGGFDPAAGDEFQVMAFASRAGDFAVANLNISGGKIASAVFEPTRLILRITAPGADVTGLVLNGGSVNRSGLATLTLQFDEAITVPGVTSLHLWNHTTGAAVDLSGATLENNSTNAVTWNFSGIALPDGNYTATLLEDVGLSATHSSLFHVLAGDSNGSAGVEFGDFGDLTNGFNTVGGPVYGPGDMNGDGNVDFGDFGVLANGFNNVLSLPSQDFGDAAAPFPTVLSDGARHILGSGLILGATVDAEPDGQPDAAAAGDGADEDGVTFAALQAGSNAAITVIATVPGTATLNAWIDFNRDGDWDDSGEQILNDQTVTSGTNNLTAVIPSGASAGQAFARFRVSSVTGYSYDGLARDGEVEDYLVTLVAASSRSGIPANLLDFWTEPVADGGHTAKTSSAFSNVKPMPTEAIDLAIEEVASAEHGPPRLADSPSSLLDYLVDRALELAMDLPLTDDIF